MMEAFMMNMADICAEFMDMMNRDIVVFVVEYSIGDRVQIYFLFMMGMHS